MAEDDTRASRSRGPLRPALGGHTVRSFEGALNNLSDIVVRMGGLAEAQLGSAIQALAQRDSDLAERVVAADERIDDLEQDVHAATVRLLALRQPVADDLRAIVAALKISAEMERVGDYASNIAKRVLVLNQSAPMAPATAIPAIGALVQELLAGVLDAYVERDLDKAMEVWRRDAEVDQLHTALFHQLVTFMMDDPRNITPGTHLMFVAKNIERIGDHATNIAETIHFQITGRSLTAPRPKGPDAQGYAAPDDGVQE